MPYTSGKPAQALSSDELRARIPGWGADLDPKDRPSVPRERTDLVTGAHWDFPERQEETWPRERSIEHEILTPVFGTSTPPKGLSGIMRKYAYRYSEARAAALADPARRRPGRRLGEPPPVFADTASG